MDNLWKHGRIQTEILFVCQKLGVEAKQEYRGNGWRADVFAPNDSRPIAFEVQLSPQSLNKTLERQSKYARDGVFGCWLFEKPIAKLTNERPDLPVFYVEEDEDLGLMVNLGTRRKVDLHFFLENFICNNIQFRTIAHTSFKQIVRLAFYEMICWNCGQLNHLYYVETPFLSSCNAKIQPKEALWASNSIEYKDEIMELASNLARSKKEPNFTLGTVKERYSRMVGKSYLSFGCLSCDSIFGDFHVMEAKMDNMYDPNRISLEGEIELNEPFNLNIPHWCLPGDGKFCGGHKS
ncbi:MAG TPA: hypothetical protein VL092_02285 [Chitinophagaceae bacterium]|nr:hypothetical protein [Chitinophagaceae bacterium]